ncbi:hypothetical protein ACIOWF_20140 [Cellulosimicrobium cellulans]|uniref:hypothetical protein n=1 Tax=Cellulosimicrobium cellulans TaxID=1710 RepID=UPI00382EB4AE
MSIVNTTNRTRAGTSCADTTTSRTHPDGLFTLEAAAATFDLDPTLILVLTRTGRLRSTTGPDGAWRYTSGDLLDLICSSPGTGREGPSL